MDNKLDEYINGLITKILQSPNFINNPEEQKQKLAQKIMEHFNNLIFDSLVDSLTPQQLDTLKGIPMDSPQMEEKIEQFASKTANFAQKLEETLNREVEAIKNNPQVILGSQTG